MALLHHCVCGNDQLSHGCLWHYCIIAFVAIISCHAAVYGTTASLRLWQSSVATRLSMALLRHCVCGNDQLPHGCLWHYCVIAFVAMISCHTAVYGTTASLRLWQSSVATRLSMALLRHCVCGNDQLPHGCLWHYCVIAFVAMISCHTAVYGTTASLRLWQSSVATRLSMALLRHCVCGNDQLPHGCLWHYCVIAFVAMISCHAAVYGTTASLRLWQ